MRSTEIPHIIAACCLAVSLSAASACALEDPDLVTDRHTAEIAHADSALYEGCVKLVGAVVVPVSQVRALVPEQFVIAGEAAGIANVVLDSYHCDAVTVGHEARPTTTSQVGVLIESPDGTGTVNTYLLAFNPDNPHLAKLARSFGITTTKVNNQSYQQSISPEGLLESFASVSRPYHSPFDIYAAGPGVSQTWPGFVSNWWQETDEGVVKLEFVSAEIDIGFCGGSVTVQDDDSELAEILGGTDAQLDGMCMQAPFDVGYLTVSLQ